MTSEQKAWVLARQRLLADRPLPTPLEPRAAGSLRKLAHRWATSDLGMIQVPILLALATTVLCGMHGLTIDGLPLPDGREAALDEALSWLTGLYLLDMAAKIVGLGGLDVYLRSGAQRRARGSHPSAPCKPPARPLPHPRSWPPRNSPTSTPFNMAGVTSLEPLRRRADAGLLLRLCPAPAAHLALRIDGRHHHGAPALLAWPARAPPPLVWHVCAHAAQALRGDADGLKRARRPHDRPLHLRHRRCAPGRGTAHPTAALRARPPPLRARGASRCAPAGPPRAAPLACQG